MSAKFPGVGGGGAGPFLARSLIHIDTISIELPMPILYFKGLPVKISII